MEDIKNAKEKVLDVYKQLQPIVDGVVSKNAKDIDNLIKKIKTNLTTLTNKELQEFMLQLSVETYYFATIKDSAILKQECATALLNEGIANVFNSTAGTQMVRTNQATMDNLDKQTVKILYNAVANNMKSKLDEAHRMINVLSSVLISKNAEAKLQNNIYPDNNKGESSNE